MRPLLEKEIPLFLERFDFFKDSEFRSIKTISPTIFKITLAAQDSARGFDWISMELEFSGVVDARLLDSSKLSHVDMSDGISIIHANNTFSFSIGAYSNPSSIKNSICYIISSSLKYEEGSF